MLQNKKAGHVHINIGSDLKFEAENVLKDMGLSLSEAIRIFLRQVVRDREIPFNVRYSANTHTTSHFVQNNKNNVTNTKESAS